ncbi:Myc-type basic helix-loop-helix (bHLH) domain-containing protein [Dioscorea alata]|uniref:Myc-type basic helix-loop-helix (BHLH) domain-containing protein n=1 Tax=Dioscorea alata TaxID=55571 RepID=A0ACB7UVX9_DIOAL|nr:Myc-type basic helix-loop-helix (bHLH) domain-containing protein [Dioscorea alata]
MDPWKPSDPFFQPPPSVPLTTSGFHTSCADLRPSSDQQQPGSSCQKIEQENKDSISARKVQKADREKLRRDKLNEQFSELGNTLDPDRPKNDKATILTDAIQVLKDLTSQVNRMKAEHASLCDESQELVQEKNELREEKATLKADIDNLNAQYHQRLRALFPWAAMDPSGVMGPPPPYSFPMPVPIASGPIPVHPTPPYHFFRNQNPGTISIPYSMYTPYSSSFANAQVDPSSNHRRTPHHHASSNNSHTSSAQKKASNDQQQNCNERSDDFSDVATELELKTPGSSVPYVHSEAAKDQDPSPEEGKRRKQWSGSAHPKSNIVTEATSSSRCSSCVLPDSSCTSAGDEMVTDNR